MKKYLKAGEIAYNVMNEALKMIKPGALLYDIAERIEKRILELGGRPAFPVNISIAHEAAHYTPTIGDSKRIPESGIVKVDIGVHVDGYIADMARSIDLDGRYERIVTAAREALDKAVERISVGVSAREIGRVVESIAKNYGFKPVKNLSGHRLERYNLHAGNNIPNYPDPLALWRFSDNSAYAVEPFITTGSGIVSEDKNTVTIYSLRNVKTSPASDSVREIVSLIERRFSKLPFCGRWLRDAYSNADRILRELYNRKILYGYPLLLDNPGSQVAQFEDTVVIFERQVIVTTRRRDIM